MLKLESVAATARLGAVVLLLAPAAGCTTIRPVGSLETGDSASGAGVEVRVFASRRADDAAEQRPGGVVGVLERSTDRGWREVFRTSHSNWVVMGLSPGEYRVRIQEVLDDQGREVPIAELRRALTLETGTIARVEAILRDRSPVRRTAGFLGKAALFAAAVAIDESLDGEPEPYDPDRIYQPPPRLGEIVLEELTAGQEGDPGAAAVEAGIVFSHFPAEGAALAGSGLRVIVGLSSPVAGGTVDPRAVVVTRSNGEAVPGRAIYDGRRWWLVWRPTASLPAGETLAVRVDLPGATDWFGTDLGGVSLFTFRSAGGIRR